MADWESIRLRPWEMPDSQHSLDDLLYMLQVVQGVRIKGGSLTPTEADAVMVALVDKINRIKANS